MIVFVRLPVTEGEQCHVRFGQLDVRFNQVAVETIKLFTEYQLK